MIFHTQLNTYINDFPPCPIQVKKMRLVIQRDIDDFKEPNIVGAIDNSSISKGIKYSVATGNWGVGKNAVAGQAAKTGVSQVAPPQAKSGGSLFLENTQL